MLAREPEMLSFIPFARYVSLSKAMDHEIGLDAGTFTLAKSPAKLKKVDWDQVVRSLND